MISKHSHQSFRLLSNAFSFNNGLLKIAKLKQSLNVKWSRIPKGTVGMVKNRKLSKHISDASWSKFVSMLQYKANWYDRTLSFVSTWFPSSQLCSNCGIIAGKKPLNVRKWVCPNCYIEHDRDINAANNILTAGLAGFACGDNTARDLT